jgi:hypothetical protein
MTRIRVNTDDLKNEAKDFESAAEAFARAGDDIAAAAMAMPSYDGQLSGPAFKEGQEFQNLAYQRVCTEGGIWCKITFDRNQSCDRITEKSGKDK